MYGCLLFLIGVTKMLYTNWEALFMFAINSPTCSGPKTSPLCHVPRFIKGEGSEKLTAINDLTKTLIVRKGLDCGLVRPHVLMALFPPCWLLEPPFKIARMTVFITVQFQRFPTWTSCGCRSNYRNYRSLLRSCWGPPYFVNTQSSDLDWNQQKNRFVDKTRRNWCV